METDSFDFMAQKVTRSMFEVLEILDRFREPFRSGGITAIEELYFRITNGKYLDWENLKHESIELLTKQMEEALAETPCLPDSKSTTK